MGKLRSQPPAVSPEQRAQIDERGRLESELALIRPKILRAQALDKIIRSWCVGSGETSFMFEGNSYAVVVGMAGEQTRITSLNDVFRVLKRTRFLELCSMTLEKLRSAVTPEQLAQLTVKERTGSRSIEVVPKLDL